jgi:hypothetical protein
METMTEEKPTTATLTTLDRCDADCPAAARVVVEIQGSELMFCGHHYAKHETAFAILGAVVKDERHIDIKDSQKIPVNG